MIRARLAAASLLAVGASFAAEPPRSSPVVHELSAALGPRAKNLHAAPKVEELVALFAVEERSAVIERLDALDRATFSPASWSELSRAYSVLGAHEKAAQTGMSLQAASPEKTDGYVLASSAHYAAEDYEAAARVAERALKEHPGDKALLALLHQSKGRHRASSPSEGMPGRSPAPETSSEMSDARPLKLAVKVKPAEAPPELEEETPAPPASGGLPWTPVAAGVVLIGYGVARSRGTWSKQESEAPGDEPPDSERLLTNRRRLRIAAASAAVGFAVVYGPAAVRVAAPAAVRFVQGAGTSLQRVATSNAGAVFPEDQIAARRLASTRGVTMLSSGSSSAARFFEGTRYSSKVLAQMRRPDYHAFPEMIKNHAGRGQVVPLTGADGVVRMRLRIPGSYNGKSGIFEFIKEPDGMINHRLFIPD